MIGDDVFYDDRNEEVLASRGEGLERAARFLDGWLRENPQPMDEHGLMHGRLPDAFLRAWMIEEEVRKLRERLEAMTLEEMASESSTDFARYLAESQKAFERRARMSELGKSSGKSRREGRDGEESLIDKILREYDRRKKAGRWDRNSAASLAKNFDCSDHYVRDVIHKYRPDGRFPERNA